MSNAANRIQEIIDEAEAAADEIRADAERDATAYAEQRRRAADAYAEQRRRETDALAVAQAHELKAQLGTLRTTLEGLETRKAEVISDALKTVESLENVASEAATSALAEAVAEKPNLAPARAALNAPSEATPSPAAKQEASPPADEEGDYELALIRATQLAVRGSDRNEIERTLVNEFSIREPAVIVDQIL